MRTSLHCDVYSRISLNFLFTVTCLAMYGIGNGFHKASNKTDLGTSAQCVWYQRLSKQLRSYRNFQLSWWTNLMKQSSMSWSAKEIMQTWVNLIHRVNELTLGLPATMKAWNRHMTEAVKCDVKHNSINRSTPPVPRSDRIVAIFPLVIVRGWLIEYIQICNNFKDAFYYIPFHSIILYSILSYSYEYN